MTKERALFALLVALLALGPWALPPFYVTLLNYIGLYSIVALGLVLLTGVGGLISFGQAAFVGLGAYTTAYLTTAFGVSPWLTLIAGLAVTAAVALFLGVLTLRLSGHYLPLGTIAWGISLYFLFGNMGALGGFTGITGIPALEVFGFPIVTGAHFYYLIWLTLLAAIIASNNLLGSREGRAIRALKGGTVMAEAMGVDTARSKIIVFVIAALFAGVSGWLYAHFQRFVNPTPFSLGQGIEYLFMAVIGGAGSVWGAVIGASVITILKTWLQDLLPKIFGAGGNFEIIVFGILMIVVLQRTRDGIWPLLSRVLPRTKRAPSTDRARPLPRRTLPEPGTTVLEVRNVGKNFGGLVANHDLNLTVHAGEILSIIGPNGAGKSTLFNVISGLLPLSSGEVIFRGTRIDGLVSRDIAGRGLSRTFQHVRLLREMSVIENVAIGAHRRGKRGVIAAALRLEREEEASLLSEAARQIERVGLSEHRSDPAAALALGKQRIVEIARALSSDPCLLLLDEPAAGLRYLEKRALADLLRKLKGEGMAILLVEHDMDFVMGLADRILVMDFGEKLAEGLPPEVARDPVVIEAYLGSVE